MPNAFPAAVGDLSKHWTLDPNVVFLNHGSFGACPRVVLDEQTRWRERLEREPVLFLGREIEPLLDEARAALGRFLGSHADNLAFVSNATAGVNAVLRSLRFAPGDEIVVLDQEYNATTNAAIAVAERAGANVIVVRTRFPLESPTEIVTPVVSALGPKTKLVIIDHVTSQTGLVLPVEPVIAACRARGIRVLVDGAHAPAMLPLALDELGADFYTGNCHKWLCAPKGAAFLYVRPDHHDAIRPLSISHGLNSTRTDRNKYRLLFDWTGTDDPTAFLCVPASIRFLETLLPGGVKAVRDRCRATCLAARDRILQVFEAPPPAPESMIGSLATIPLPAWARGDAPPPLFIHAIQTELFDRHRIEIPVMPWPDGNTWHLRLSAAAYNTPAHYEALADALTTIRRSR